MATVADLAAFMETIAPRNRKMDWDNVGLLCGRMDKTVKKLLIALDPFEGVADEAIAWDADMIITHHPLIFRPVYSVTQDSSVGRTILKLAQNDIAAFNAHTNLDMAPGGVNDVLAGLLGLQQISVIDPTDTDEQGRAWGLLRCGNVEPQGLEVFLKYVKERLHTPVLRYADGGREVHRVAVGGGACAGEFRDVIAAGCDTFVTSDAKYNDFWDCADAGVTLIDAGHFYTENPVCTDLCSRISAQFPDIAIQISKTHGDCMKFF